MVHFHQPFRIAIDELGRIVAAFLFDRQAFSIVSLSFFAPMLGTHYPASLLALLSPHQDPDTTAIREALDSVRDKKLEK